MKFENNYVQMAINGKIRIKGMFVTIRQSVSYEIKYRKRWQLDFKRAALVSLKGAFCW